MVVNLSIPGQPNVTITMINDHEDAKTINHEMLSRDVKNPKRYIERRNLHIARDRLGRECGRVFPVKQN